MAVDVNSEYTNLVELLPLIYLIICPYFVLLILQLKFKNKQCHSETTALSMKNYKKMTSVQQTGMEYNYNECTNLHKLTAKVIQTIPVVFDKHAPNKIISNSMRKKLMRPWITTGILKSIKTKQRMYKTHFLSGNP